VFSQTYQIQGQLSGWTYIQEKSFSDSQLGFRYIPVLSLEKSIDRNSIVDLEASLKVIASERFRSVEKMARSGQL